MQKGDKNNVLIVAIVGIVAIVALLIYAKGSTGAPIGVGSGGVAITTGTSNDPDCFKTSKTGQSVNGDTVTGYTCLKGGKWKIQYE